MKEFIVTLFVDEKRMRLRALENKMAVCVCVKFFVYFFSLDT